MAANREDRRIQRTKSALLEAFRALVFEQRRYDQIRVADLIERAGVGRSTFYEHYRNKDEILAESIRAPFEHLADAVEPAYQVARLCKILEHFWDNRAQARSIFSRSARRPVSRILASMIEERLRARSRRANGTVAQSKLVAVAIAETQLGSISAWLAGEMPCDVTQLAEMLHRITQASVAAVFDR